MMYKGEQEAPHEACWLGRSAFNDIAAAAGLNFADEKPALAKRRMSLL
jgi:hypothetical protein